MDSRWRQREAHRAQEGVNGTREDIYGFELDIARHSSRDLVIQGFKIGNLLEGIESEVTDWRLRISWRYAIPISGTKRSSASSPSRHSFKSSVILPGSLSQSRTVVRKG